MMENGKSYKWLLKRVDCCSIVGKTLHHITTILSLVETVECGVLFFECGVLFLSNKTILSF